MPTVIGDAVIRSRLREELPGWQLKGRGEAKRIETTYALPAFIQIIQLVKLIAQEAERVNHHPDMTIKYDHITFGLTTHDSGGITEKDFSLAKRIAKIAQRKSRRSAR